MAKKESVPVKLDEKELLRLVRGGAVEKAGVEITFDTSAIHADELCEVIDALEDLIEDLEKLDDEEEEDLDEDGDHDPDEEDDE